MKTYRVWFEPTEKGAEAFGWKAEPVGLPADDPEDAAAECYERSLEERAPDFCEYARYVVREEGTE